MAGDEETKTTEQEAKAQLEDKAAEEAEEEGRLIYCCGLQRMGAVSFTPYIFAHFGRLVRLSML